jgi:hypothetical protein
MLSWLKYGTLDGWIRLAFCVLGLAMLISFPIQSGHQFINHLRTEKISQQIKRHTSVAQPEANCAQQVDHPAVNPNLIKTPVLRVAEPRFESETLDPEPSVGRFLLRIKFGSARKDSSPPLLQ